jgi:hypothetical protein
MILSHFILAMLLIYLNAYLSLWAGKEHRRFTPLICFLVRVPFRLCGMVDISSVLGEASLEET